MLLSRFTSILGFENGLPTYNEGQALSCLFNRPFLSCHLSQCPNKSSRETIHLNRCSTFRFIFMQIKLTLQEKGFARTRFETEAQRTCFETEAQGNSEMAC